MNESQNKPKLSTSAAETDFINEFFFDENSLPHWIAQMKHGNILMKIIYYFLISFRLS